jgi:hypothetical protein
MAYLPPGGGHESPYGDAVGLAEPLKDGDCVAARWPGTPFIGKPGLRVVPCVGDDTEGQVMAVFEAGSAEEARTAGAAQCEQRTEETRKKLASVRSYAVVPTGDGFDAARHRVACLLLEARGGAVFGPLGEHRKPGTVFTDTATMQKRDCLDVVSNDQATLVSCKGPHKEKVLDFLRLSADTTLKEARDQATEACRREMPPKDYGYDPNVYTASSWVGDSAWQSGTHFVVCTAIREDGGTIEGDEP